MNDYLIAAACIIGPLFFFAAGWALRIMVYRREWQEAINARQEQAERLFAVTQQRPSDPWNEINRMAREWHRTHREN